MTDDEECPYLQVYTWVKTGRERYRCEWMEGGVLRECNHRSLYECCPARLEYDKEFREK